MTARSNTHQPLKVVIVGAGLGGLVAAISCLRGGCEVIILEQAPAISPIGAGIQIPPNAARVLQHFGLEQKIRDAGAIQVNANHLKRYKDGKILCSRMGGEKMVRDFDGPWFVIHRADYHRVLLDEAVRLGAEIRLNSKLVAIESSETPQVVLETGEVVYADVIVGADGLWSAVRDAVLGRPSPPNPTGDLVFRATASLEQLEALNDPGIDELIHSRCTYNWIGPDRHSVFYPVRDGKVFNLVLACPDDLAPNSRTEASDVDEMRMTYSGWDPVLTKILSCLQGSVLKWKLCHHEELRTWVKENTVLIGDASHPSLPYQAQGAAMAVEDGLVLGLLLGGLNASDRIVEKDKQSHINSILRLFESLRKERTTTNVKGAVANRYMYQMHDGPEQEARDRQLGEADWVKPSKWGWADPGYQREMLGFDSIADTTQALEVWLSEEWR